MQAGHESGTVPGPKIKVNIEKIQSSDSWLLWEIKNILRYTIKTLTQLIFKIKMNKEAKIHDRVV